MCPLYKVPMNTVLGCWVLMAKRAYISFPTSSACCYCFCEGFVSVRFLFLIPTYFTTSTIKVLHTPDAWDFVSLTGVWDTLEIRSWNMWVVHTDILTTKTNLNHALLDLFHKMLHMILLRTSGDFNNLLGTFTTIVKVKCYSTVISLYKYYYIPRFLGEGIGL